MKEENKALNLRTFAQTWDFETKLYSIGDVTLPFAVNMTQLGFFAISFMLCMLLYKIIPPLAALPALWKYAVIPFGMMWAGTKLRVDDKKPYMWIIEEIVYAVYQPKMMNKFRRTTSYSAFSFGGKKRKGRKK